MKTLVKYFCLLLVCFGQSGCFLLSSSGNSSSNSSSTSSKAVYTSDQLLCAHRWELTHATVSTHYYKNGQFQSTKTNSSTDYNRKQWIQFYSNHTCYASGIFGCNGSQQLRWERVGNNVTIYGQNLKLGEVVANQAEYNVEAITSNYLRITRLCTPKTTDGNYRVSTLTFDNQSTAQSNTSTKSISQMLIKRWRFQQAYNSINSKAYDVVTNSSYWIQFYPNGTCREDGILGTGNRQQLTWKVSNNQLYIYGQNLSYGEIVSSQVVYTIENITENQLQLRRPNGRKQDGTEIIRKIVFDY